MLTILLIIVICCALQEDKKKKAEKKKAEKRKKELARARKKRMKNGVLDLFFGPVPGYEDSNEEQIYKRLLYERGERITPY